MADTMSEQQNFHLDDLLCFTLYSTNNLINRLYTPQLKKLGLTYPQYLVITVLWEHEPMLVKDIGSKLFLQTNTLTPLLKRMERQGLLIRERSKDDERQVRVHLTEKGRKKKKDSNCIPDTLLNAMEHDSEKIRSLNTLLKQLQTAVR